MSHTAYKVPVGGGDALLPSRQNSHVASQAGTAGRRADYGSRLHKGLHPAFSDALKVNGLGRRNDDATDALFHLSAL